MKRQLRIVCREAGHRRNIVLHAVIKMEGSVKGWMNLRCHLSGGGIKLPKGAVIKSHGAERLGKAMPRVCAGKGKGVERE